MAEKKTATRTASKAFTAEEQAAMRERAREVRASRSGKKDGEGELLAKIAEMNESDRDMAERVHAIVTANAPELAPTTWYGMPAYARGGDVVCFFQPAQKFKARYSTLGFSDKANLDDGGVWPSSYALAKLTKADETRLAAVVRKAVS